MGSRADERALIEAFKHITPLHATNNGQTDIITGKIDVYAVQIDNKDGSNTSLEIADATSGTVYKSVFMPSGRGTREVTFLGRPIPMNGLSVDRPEADDHIIDLTILYRTVAD